MASITRLLLIAPLLASLHGCGDDTTPGNPAGQSPDIHLQASSTFAERLLLNLDERDTWPSNGVKIWLNNPTVSVSVSLPESDTVRVDAWARNENDFGVAMMRLDQGDTLYAISDDEFRALQEYGESAGGRR